MSATPATPTSLLLTPLTPRATGAVALLHLAGPADSLTAALNQLTTHDNGSDTPLGRARLTRIADVDEGLVTRLSPSLAQLAPHGGVAVVDAIIDAFGDLGVTVDPDPSPTIAYPEAASPIDADALAAIAAAASPAAIPVLAAQPDAWRRWHADPHRTPPAPPPGLDHLLAPPTIVFVGRPNVGKSTLTNALTAADTAITSPLAGTTRDHLAAETFLALPPRASSTAQPDALHRLAVRLLDTPGLRTSTDPIERRAIAAARHVIAEADCLIALRDPSTDWPDPDALPRTPDLRVLNKADLADASPDPSIGPATDQNALAVSALTRAGLPQLIAAIVDALRIPNLTRPHDLPPWAFCDTLRHALADPAFDWPAHLGEDCPTR